VELAEAILRLAFETPGIAPAAGIAELVWDEGIVAITLDNPGSEPFTVPFLPDGSGVDGLQLSHLHLTTALGVLLGRCGTSRRCRQPAPRMAATPFC